MHASHAGAGVRGIKIGAAVAARERGTALASSVCISAQAEHSTYLAFTLLEPHVSLLRRKPTIAKDTMFAVVCRCR